MLSCSWFCTQNSVRPIMKALEAEGFACGTDPAGAGSAFASLSRDDLKGLPALNLRQVATVLAAQLGGSALQSDSLIMPSTQFGYCMACADVARPAPLWCPHPANVATAAMNACMHACGLGAHACGSAQCTQTKCVFSAYPCTFMQAAIQFMFMLVW